MKFFYTLLILFSIQHVFAQDKSGLPGLIPYRKGNLWGYSDSTKKILIKPQFDEPSEFTTYYGWKPGHPKIALIRKNKKQGIIDESGSFLIKCEFDIFDYRMYPNNSSNLVYLQKGKEAYHYTFEENRLIPVTPEVFDPNEVIEPIIEAILENDYTNDSNVSIISTDKRHYSVTMKKYVPFTNQLIGIDSIQLIGSEIKAVSKIDTLFYIRENKKWGIISKENKVVVKAEYDSIYHIWGGQVFAVQNNKNWGLIYPSKLISSPFIYQDIKNNANSEGYLIKRNSKWGVLLDDFKTEILIDKNLYKAYYIMRNNNLICIWNESDKIIGYVDFYGTKYWE